MSKSSKTVFSRIEFILDIFLVLLIAAIVVAVNIQIFTRYFLGYGTAWSAVLSQYLFVWITIFGSASAIRKLAHFTVDFFPQKLSPKLQRIIFVGTTCCLAFFFFVMIYSGIKQVLSTWNMQETALGISAAYLYLPIPISGVIMFAFLLERAFKK